MTVSIIYHSRFGNNTAIAQRISDRLESLGHGVSVHPISEANTNEIPAADIYIFGSPTQIGSLPIRMEKFLRRMSIPKGAGYAAFATRAQPGSTTARKLEDTVEAMGAQKIQDALVLSVKDLRGPIEENWEAKSDAWAETLSDAMQTR